MKQLLSIPEAAAEVGSRTRVYELIGAGKLAAVKIGNRTRVTSESLSAFIASLPAAEIAPSRRKRAVA
jgi:excisionase family DNA binding protein